MNKSLTDSGFTMNIVEYGDETDNERLINLCFDYYMIKILLVPHHFLYLFIYSYLFPFFYYYLLSLSYLYDF